MAEDLPQEDFGEKDNRLRFAILGLLFGGLFILAVGLGLIFFKNQKNDDIRIISAGSEAEPGSELVVHVDGAVVKPGLYKLPFNSRVGDAVSAAGGLSKEADLARINLAAKVKDGQKIQVAKAGENSINGAGSVAGQSANSLININSATESELDKLPGVGPATAKKIIASRPYGAPEDLLVKKAVSNSVYEKIKDLVTY